MDDVNRFARELADAIAAAISDHPKVDACRERARAAGYEMRVTLEAVVGFVSRDKEKDREKDKEKLALAPGKAAARLTPAQAFEITTNDKRFLRSLRIAADETTEEVN
jgi:alkanesulfonate monooxygenase SsuD/methylene tetrahydromethanopterin reductase-like flavin-dependent oxidoreductase (luciferase family)